MDGQEAVPGPVPGIKPGRDKTVLALAGSPRPAIHFRLAHLAGLD